MTQPHNLHIVHNLESAICPLPSHSTVHATYGDFTDDVRSIVPATLASFQYLMDRSALMKSRDILLIGVRSDYAIELEKLRNGDTYTKPVLWEPKETRGLHVGEALARQHPDRAVIVAFYDDAEEFFSKLRYSLNCELYTLHQNFPCGNIAPKIQGMQHATMTFGFEVPMAVNQSVDTSFELLPDIHIVDLTKSQGAHGKPYVSDEGKILFPVNHRSLERFTPEGTLFDRMKRLARSEQKVELQQQP